MISIAEISTGNFYKHYKKLSLHTYTYSLTMLLYGILIFLPLEVGILVFFIMNIDKLNSIS